MAKIVIRLVVKVKDMYSPSNYYKELHDFQYAMHYTKYMPAYIGI